MKVLALLIVAGAALAAVFIVFKPVGFWGSLFLLFMFIYGATRR